MKKNKGFTMVELLGAIVVLGILMMVAVPTVSNLISNSKDRYYETQKKNLINAAKTYFRNTNMVLREIGDSEIITMDQLVNGKYISVVKDVEKSDCIGSATGVEEKQQKYTFVRVKKEKNKITYTAHLYCPAKTDDQLIEDDGHSPVTIDIVKGSTGRSIQASIKGHGVKVHKYSYSIYVGGRNETIADNLIANKSEEIDKENATITYDVSDLLAKFSTTISCYVVTIDENGHTSKAWFTGDFTAAGTPTCVDVAAKVTDLDSQLQIDYDFKCNSTNGCQSDYYHGTYYRSVNASTYGNLSSNFSVNIYDKVSGTVGTCTISYSFVREAPIIQPDPTPVVPTCVTPSSSVSCPQVDKSSTAWTKNNITVCYVMSKKSTGFAIRSAQSKKGTWKRKAADGKKPTLKFKKKGYSSLPYNNSDNSKYQRKITFSKTGKHYFVIRVRQKSSSSASAKHTICGTTYAYGPYRIDKNKPTLSSKKVTANGLKITRKCTVKDPHSGIAYILVNTNKTESQKTVIKKGTKYTKYPTKVAYKKTTKMKKGTYTFYVHAIDRLGNQANIKCGKATAKPNPLAGKSGCNWVGTKKHSAGFQCTCGSGHSSGYFRYCIKNGKAYKVNSSPRYFCPGLPKYGNFRCDGVYYKRIKGY